MDEIELSYSKHCQSITVESQTIDVQIYSSGKSDWILEVVNEAGTLIVWEDQFASDDEAYTEFTKTLKEEGISAFN